MPALPFPSLPAKPTQAKPTQVPPAVKPPQAPPPAKPTSAKPPLAPTSAKPSPAPAAAAPQVPVQASAQVTFLIGPPAGPEEMRALYAQAAQLSLAGNDSMAKKLFDLRHRTVVYATQPEPQQKAMLRRILEEKLGRELGAIAAEVGGAVTKGLMVPSLTIALDQTRYADGRPIAPDITKDMLKVLENVLGFVFQAQWIETSQR